MPTIKRKWYPGASYHVTERGNHRNDIFKDKEDFLFYLTLMNGADILCTLVTKRKYNL